MHILLTNDDGIDSNGIWALARELKTIADVTVVAPDGQQSAVSHALNISTPLRLHKYFKEGEFFGFAVNGTPSDCVKLALDQVCTDKPDMVISGINHGQNTSVNIVYSGTVAGAFEGSLLGIKSMAVSATSFDVHDDCIGPAKFAKKVCSQIADLDMERGTILNLNIPSLDYDKIKGLKITNLSNAKWIDKYDKRKDPFGREYYWFAGEYILPEDEQNSDDIVLTKGYASLTPIKYNFINTKFIDKLRFMEK